MGEFQIVVVVQLLVKRVCRQGVLGYPRGSECAQQASEVMLLGGLTMNLLNFQNEDCSSVEARRARCSNYEKMSRSDSNVCR